MDRVIIVDRLLTAPPSETYAFRTLGTYFTSFVNAKILVELHWEERDAYNQWFKSQYYFDFVDDFVEIGTESGIRIYPHPISDRLVLENLNLCYNYFSEFCD